MFELVTCERFSFQYSWKTYSIYNRKRYELEKSMFAECIIIILYSHTWPLFNTLSHLIYPTRLQQTTITTLSRNSFCVYCNKISPSSNIRMTMYSDDNILHMYNAISANTSIMKRLNTIFMIMAKYVVWNEQYKSFMKIKLVYMNIFIPGINNRWEMLSTN